MKHLSLEEEVPMEMERKKSMSNSVNLLEELDSKSKQMALTANKSVCDIELQNNKTRMYHIVSTRV